MQPRPAGIALGSNLGESSAIVQRAIARLAEISADGGILVAPEIRTHPIGCPPGSPDFLNTVVEISYMGDATRLLAAMQEIEAALGRMRSVRNAPRTIDLDLLYFGNEIIRTSALTIPHPRMTSRRFVLAPLAAIRPGLILPSETKTVLELLAELDTTAPSAD